MLVVTNKPSEDFTDAGYFLRIAQTETDNFIKRRYLRASCIFFCAAVEAWYNRTIAHYLATKSNKSDKEERLYQYLTDPQADYFNKNVSKSLKKYLPDAINIDSTTLNEAILEEYIELTQLRNNIAHYIDATHDQVYDIGYMETILIDAPRRIRNLIRMYQTIDSGHWVSRDV